MTASAAPTNVLFVHDGGEQAERLAQVLATPASVGVDLPRSMDADHIIVVVGDVRRWTWLEKMQDQVLDGGAACLPITCEPGRLWYGPLHRADRAACLSCFRQWLRGNYRDPYHWSAGTNIAMSRSGRPWSPAAIGIVRTLLIERIRANVLVGTGEQRYLMRFDAARLLTSRYPFFAHPQCSYCDNRPADSPSRAQLVLADQCKSSPYQYRVDNPKLTLSALRDRFVNRHSGLIKHVFQDLVSDITPMYCAEMPIVGSADATEYGYGRTDTRGKAELVSVLEALERYAGHAPRGKRTSVRGSYAQLAADAVDPESFVLHLPQRHDEPGFRLHRYSPDLEYAWCWGYSFKTKESRLVPEQLVYYWLEAVNGQPVNRFVYDSSNGCAMGGCLEEAILCGLLELVERDAYLTTWYGRFVPTEIALQSVDDIRVQALVARTRAQGFQLHVFDIRLDIDVPAVWAMIVDPSPHAAVKSYCAAGAHLHPVEAIYSALVEVTTSMSVYRQSLPAMRDKAEAMFADHSTVQDMSDHVLLYSLPDTFEYLQFLFAKQQQAIAFEELYPPVSSQPSLNLKDDCEIVVDKVLQVADDLMVVDQTFSALEQQGLHCVRVLAPGLSPVTFGHQYRRIALDRINRAAKAKGVAHFSNEADVNPVPHNFP